MSPDGYLDQLRQALSATECTLLPQIAEVLALVRQRGATVYVMGNGGSAANASHLVLHLREVGVRAVDLLADVPYLSALSNDHSYEGAARLRLAREAGPGDVLVVVSGSGNSANVVLALAEAVKGSRRMITLGLLGFDGGAALKLCDYALWVNSDSYAICEDVHSAVIHALKAMLGPA